MIIHVMEIIDIYIYIIADTPKYNVYIFVYTYIYKYVYIIFSMADAIINGSMFVF